MSSLSGCVTIAGMEISNELRSLLSDMGKEGGRSKSEAKRAAAKANVAKARAAQRGLRRKRKARKNETV